MATASDCLRLGRGALAGRLRVVLGRLHAACAGHTEPSCLWSPSTPLRVGPQQGWGSWSAHCPRCGVPQGAGTWVSGSCASCLPQGLALGRCCLPVRWFWRPVPQDPGRKARSAGGGASCQRPCALGAPAYLSPITGQIFQSHVNVYSVYKAVLFFFFLNRLSLNTVIFYLPAWGCLCECKARIGVELDQELGGLAGDPHSPLVLGAGCRV